MITRPWSSFLCGEGRGVDDHQTREKMNGQLSEHPLAELITEICAKGLFGALRVKRERVRAVIYFEAGQLIYATSNLRVYRLTEYVRKLGLITAEIAKTKENASDFEVAATLLSSGVLTGKALSRIRSEQVADVLRMLLLLTDGDWSFESRARLTEAVQLKLNLTQLLIEAGRRLDLKFASSRFLNPEELISPGSISAAQSSLSATEGFLLSRVEGPISVSELTTISGIREQDARRMIYALVVAGLLKREFQSPAMPTAGQPAAKASALVARGRASIKEPAASDITESQRDPTEELTEFLDALDRATSHYGVLQASAQANPADIKNAYHSLARRFHPDRFHELSGTPLHTRLESAFARITQAHELLSDATQRASYDLKLAAARKVSASVQTSRSAHGSRMVEPGEHDYELKTAEQRFHEGLTALQLGQVNVAISCLSAAAKIAPGEHSYRAHYGRALAANQKTRRLAETELLAAIKLAPENAAYRVMLASLYRSLGLPKRAVGELERALSLDPENAEAKQLLRRLEVS